MSRLPLLVALPVLAGALAPFAPAFAGATAGVPLANGDQITADIDTSTDEDAFVSHLTAGTTLTVELLMPRGSGFLPRLKGFRPDGVELALDGILVGEGTPKVTLTLPPLNQTGAWRFVVGGKLGTAGSYTIRLKAKRPTKAALKGNAVADGAWFERAIPGGDGDVLTFSAKAKSGAAPGEVQVVDPSGEPLAGVEAALKRSGTGVAGKKIVLAGGFGDYLLRIRNPGPGAATLDVKTALKPVKTGKRKEALGAEPRPASLNPATGRDGVSVTIAGKDFLPGATVYFGSAEATDVVVVGTTQITCKAPPGDESDAGDEVGVCVVNPDFQVGNATARFAFHGLAAATSLSPGLSPLAGGQTVLVAGTQFRAGSSVVVDGVPATGVIVGSATSISFVTPAHAAGSVEVVVVDEYGRPGSVVTGLRYSDPPVILSASPPTIPSFGLKPVTVTGQNFHPGTTVLLDGVAATGVTLLSDTSIRFVPPGGLAGPATIEVRDVLNRSDIDSSVLTRTRSLVNVTTAAAPPAPTGTEFFAASIGVGDLDGDGRPDMLLASPTLRSGGTFGTQPGSRLLRNDGTGAFTDVSGTNHVIFNGNGGDFGQAHAAVLTDFTKDGRADALLAMREVLTSSSVEFPYPGGYTGTYVGDVPTLISSRFLLNNGLGVLSNATSTRIPSPQSTPDHGLGNRFQASTVLVGDLDNDTDIDMVLVSSGGVTRGLISNVKKTTTKVQYYYYYYNYYPDKAYVYQSASLASSTRILRNGGTGTFTFSWTALPAPAYSGGGNLVDDFRADGATLGDVDGDGVRDLVLVSSLPRQVNDSNPYFAPALRVMKGGASATFTRLTSAIPASYESTHANSGDHWQGKAVALVDLTGDSRPEIIVGRETFSYWVDGSSDALLPAIRIFRNNGSGSFTEDTESFLDPSLFRTGSMSTILGVTDIQVGDVDGDGRQDVLLTGKVHEVASVGGTGMGPKKILPSGTRPATRLLRRTASNTLEDVTADWIPAGTNGDWLQSDVVRLFDMNGDGRLDVVLGAETNPKTNGQTVNSNRPLRILKNQ